MRCPACGGPGNGWGECASCCRAAESVRRAVEAGRPIPRNAFPEDAVDYDAAQRYADEEAHESRYGYGLSQPLDENALCPCCGQKLPGAQCPRCASAHTPALTDVGGACCEGCAERDAEGDVVLGEEGRL